ncbi:MAG: L-arabinose isomerase [Bacteroidetes bacterium GWF2_40_14]|nr:MAG: L-arabinose isomerase [Bacteroidetes bacterium GWF2_40_14]
MNLPAYEVWFITGSQHLYGDEILKQVAGHSLKMVEELNATAGFPTKLIWKPTVKSSEEILSTIIAANSEEKCVGIITWMHTFSPAKMWIAGLKALRKPICHLHTQFNSEIPWSEIDMDFMNLNQSAHGDREFGHIVSRMKLGVKVVVGYWKDREVWERLDKWLRVCNAWADAQDMKIARFGDNMNNVAVTDGDKVDAELRLGYHVDYYPIGDLVGYVEKVTPSEYGVLLSEYDKMYEFEPEAREGGKKRTSVVEAARIEVAMRKFLEERKIKAFTTNFNALHGLHQLPGLACQRLMSEGIGFGAEGDWKTAALLRSMKVMANGLKGGTSFMEDYTYNFDGKNSAILQAHMLEVCPSIAAARPRLEVHPLGIGGKADPARLVFNTASGRGIAATIVDMGNRFRMIVNDVEIIDTKAPLPKLPVARAYWKPMPDLMTSAHAWILAGGTHHTSFSVAIDNEYLEDFAQIADIEMLVIDRNTTIGNFKKDIKLNDVYYKIMK